MGCRSVRSRDELVRLCLAPDGEVIIGRGGRGAWICAASAGPCLTAAIRRGALRRAFRRDIPESAAAGLAAALALDEGRGSDGQPR